MTSKLTRVHLSHPYSGLGLAKIFVIKVRVEMRLSLYLNIN